ncbi:MAG: type II toxin-antitoxin system prevent-host-death family antitoxin [Gammaproteobacteria bacterium]|nr:type II toxin-antitoxin system prevent-host-death family antitoxin [Gammaproteobacteria bacterium]
MRRVNITEFRSHLPTYMDEIQKGETIDITSRGKVIARVVPVEDAAEAARRRLIALRGKCRIGDVISPGNEEWDAEHGHL